MEAILAVATVCRLAMLDGDMPYVVALNFVHADGAIYFHSALSGRKLDLIVRNPNVCMETDVGAEFVPGDVPCKCGMHYRSVIVAGMAFLVNDHAEKLRALRAIAEKYVGRHDAIPDAAVERTAVIRMDIRSMTGKQSPAQPGCVG